MKKIDEFFTIVLREHYQDINSALNNLLMVQWCSWHHVADL